ncbi:MAG: hypothetical protein ACOYJ6_12795 [Caulobacterales bacterium]|jgi:hypothetical protein
MKSVDVHETAAAFGARFGVSVKALRINEKAGLIWLIGRVGSAGACA